MIPGTRMAPSRGISHRYSSMRRSLSSDIEDHPCRPATRGLVHLSLVVGHGLDFLADFVFMLIEGLAAGLRLEGFFIDFDDVDFLQEPSLAIVKVEDLPEEVDEKILKAVPFHQDQAGLTRLDAAEVGDDVENGKGSVGKKLLFACARDGKAEVGRVVKSGVWLHKIILVTPACVCQRPDNDIRLLFRKSW